MANVRCPSRHRHCDSRLFRWHWCKRDLFYLHIRSASDEWVWMWNEFRVARYVFYYIWKIRWTEAGAYFFCCSTVTVSVCVLRVCVCEQTYVHTHVDYLWR